MNHPRYSRRQLEEKAEILLKKFDSERLVKTKPLDVYEVIEKCLDVPYDWKYITPDQSILGLTAFKSGLIWVWPESKYVEGMLPTRIYLEKGTILIDSTLTEKEDSGQENFTVMHEVFHQILHRNFFSQYKPDYVHCTSKESLHGKRRLITPLDFCEYQANCAAAAFLMPRELVVKRVGKYRSRMLDFRNNRDYRLAKELAAEFNVSPTAMKYRLINTDLAVNEDKVRH